MKRFPDKRWTGFLLAYSSMCLGALAQTASFAVQGGTTQCENAAVTFIDTTPTNVANPVIWQWDFGDGGPKSNEQSPVHTYTTSGSFSVKLTVVFSNSVNHVVTQTITINPAPTIDFSFGTDNCQLTTQSFAATGSVSTGTITSYEWDFGDGAISSGANATHTFTTHGTFPVTLTATSSLGCESVLSREVTIYEEPVANFEFANVCDGTAVIFNNTSSISSGNTSYLWEFDDGSTSTLQAPTHTYASPGTYDVTLTVTSFDGGCDASVIRQVSVYTNPVADFSATTVCDEQVTSFTNSSAGNNLTYFWNFGDGNTSVQQAPTHTYDGPGSYMVRLEVTSAEQCVHSIERRVDVLSLPDPTFFANDACTDATVTFTNLTNESDGTLTYDWSLDDGTNIGGVNKEDQTHTYPNSGDYTVTLKASTATGCVDSVKKIVTIFPVPVADFSVNTGCSGISNTFNNLTTVTSGTIREYEWNFGDGNVSFDKDPTHTYTEANTYAVILTVTSDQGCEHTVSNPLLIYERPVTDFSFSNSCNSNDIAFTNESAASTGSLSYTWDFGDSSPTAASTDPVHPYATPGSYTVTLTSSNNNGGCFAVSTQQVAVHAIPVADFMGASVCFGEVTVFDNLSSLNDNPTFWWDFGDGTTSTFFEPTHTYENPGKYVVSMEITTDDLCVRSIQQEVNVYEQPAPSFILADVCLDAAVAFVNLTDEGDGLLTYVWDFGDTQTATSSSPEHFYDVPGTYTVTLTATSATSCVETLTKEVTVWPLPEPDFHVPDVCDGGTSVFSDQSTISSGTIDTYLWDFGDLTNSTAADPTKQYLNAGAYNVNLALTSDNGCEKAITKEAVVANVPVADFEVNDVCNGTPVQLNNLSRVDQPLDLTYEWDFGDGGTSVATAPSHLYAAPGSYDITLTTTSAASCQDVFTKTVVINGSPLVSAGVDTLISRGASVRLNAAGGVDYQWRPIEGLSNSTIGNPIARPLETTDYIVTITDAFGCVNEDTVRVALKEDFKVVPFNVFTPDGNGQNDVWVIDNADAFEKVEVKIYDRYGVLVFKDDDYRNTWQGLHGQDILPDGTYYYLITFPGTDVKYNGALTLIRNN